MMVSRLMVEMIVSRLVDPLPMRFFKVQKELIYFALSARPVRMHAPPLTWRQLTLNKSLEV
jgi:hypothetical protein